jgi:hypothetical protein
MGLLTPPPPTSASLSDDFNRANSTSSAGSQWTNQSGVMGIDTNAAYPVTTGAWVQATNNTGPLSGDDFSVTATLGALVGSGIDYTELIGGTNSSGEGAIAILLGTALAIYTQTSWGLGGAASRATNSYTWATGDVIEFRRVGNVYTTWKNGVPTPTTWTDGIGALTRDSSHRLAGVGGFAGSGAYRRIDAWTAA